MNSLITMIIDTLVYRSPKDTRNLAINGIKQQGNTVVIGNALVPYAVATNEAWVSPRWNGKSNPNEGWVDNAIIQVVRIYAAQNGYNVFVEKG